MSTVAPTTDADLLELLRTTGSIDVTELADMMEVTPTAVRQRLARLLAQGLIERDTVRAGRGRPRHRYQLTEKGNRLTGSNLTDLALALWHELGSIGDPGVRRALLVRVASSLASTYARQIDGHTTAERMRSLVEVLAQRKVPFTVETGPGPERLTVLKAHVCPYPELAEQDRTICLLEKMVFSELVGQNMELSECRLDGGTCCQFQPT
jgi:DeoR family transcriptional regulator, suf operon transcriptional repressor